MTQTIKDLETLLPMAHGLALEVIKECGSPDDSEENNPTESDFCISRDNDLWFLTWHTYGPFNPVPTWVWDGTRWVANDGDDYETWCHITGYED